MKEFGILKKSTGVPPHLKESIVVEPKGVVAQDLNPSPVTIYGKKAIAKLVDIIKTVINK